MGETRRLGNPPIDINLRRSPRARRLSLRISQLDGRVTLTMPQGVSAREGMRFAREREAWLRGHLSDMTAPRIVRVGASVPCEGRELPVRAGPVRAARLVDDAIIVPDRPEGAGHRVAALLKLLARERLVTATERHAGAIGRPFGRISLRDTRSRWGSCSSDGNLSYSWRLVMAPPEILDYVAAHEVAHLAEMNHSPAFWAIVARLYPDHRRARDWLRDNGTALHQVRFDGDTG